MQAFDFDLFVIGAGSGGVRLARMSAAKGARVAVAEDRYLGGTCVNVGCVPKKLFVYASHIREDLEDGEGFGWQHSGSLNFDWASLVNNKNTEIQRLNGIYKKLLESSGATIINGRARIIDQHTVEVNGQSYRSAKIAIATGSWPFIPDFEGNEHAITSNEFFFLETLPKRAVVLGGGYIAVEMAGIMAGLGVDTTLVYRGEQLLRGFDQELRLFVKDEIEKKGVNLLFEDNISAITRIDNDQLNVKLESGGTIEAGMVLAATGRKPHTQDLGLENIDIDYDRSGNIKVNEHYETAQKGVYALGDLIGGMQLTPVALAEGMYLAQHLFGDTPPQTVDYENIATAVFCQPNIGTVGLTEEQASERFSKLRVYTSSFKPMKHTMTGRNERSFMKLVVDDASDRVVGAHMVGPEAGEIIQGIAIAIKAGATKAHFDQTIGIHPTAAEEFVTMREVRD